LFPSAATQRVGHFSRARGSRHGTNATARVLTACAPLAAGLTSAA
jgi:hypothetical protein